MFGVWRNSATLTLFSRRYVSKRGEMILPRTRVQKTFGHTLGSGRSGTIRIHLTESFYVLFCLVTVFVLYVEHLSKRRHSIEKFRVDHPPPRRDVGNACRLNDFGQNIREKLQFSTVFSQSRSGFFLCGMRK